MAWAIEQQDILESGARHLLLCLCNYADQNGDSIFPSTKRLSRDTGMDRRTVQRHLRRLEKSILIVRSNAAIVVAQIRRGDRRPMCYRVVMTGRHNATPLIVRGGSSAPTERHVGTSPGGVLPPDPSSEPSIKPRSVLQNDPDSEKNFLRFLEELDGKVVKQ